MVFERSDEMPRGMDSVYDWVGQFRFSRPMKNTARDFSDAVLLAEILAHLVPAWVQLHNYPSAHRFQQKLSNWETLNRKVLTRLKCGISHKHQQDLASAIPGAIELLLIQVKRATAHSPFLQARQASALLKEVDSTSPRSRSSSSACSPPSTPSPAKQRQTLSPLTLSHANSFQLQDERTQEQNSIATSFSRLLELMSETADDFDDIVKPKVRIRASTSPSFQKNARARRNSSTQPLTPNYAKPTLSTMATTRPASVGAKSRAPQASFVFPLKTDHVLKPSLPEKSNVWQEADKKHLPSNTNEFQEGSFVFFLSSEALPATFSFDDPEDQAQVARVIKALPSGECTLQLFRRVPSHDSPQKSPTAKTRRYFATPHFIDCCSTLLYTIPTIAFDPQTNTCEWQVRTKRMSPSETVATRSKPIQANSVPPKRHFYTEVLTRVTLTPADLAAPISQATESLDPVVCLPCPRFAESFRIAVQPTVFPKVQVDLVFELPDRFQRRSRLNHRTM